MDGSSNNSNGDSPRSRRPLPQVSGQPTNSMYYPPQQQQQQQVPMQQQQQMYQQPLPQQQQQEVHYAPSSTGAPPSEMGFRPYYAPSSTASLQTIQQGPTSPIPYGGRTSVVYAPPGARPMTQLYVSDPNIPIASPAYALGSTVGLGSAATIAMAPSTPVRMRKPTIRHIPLTPEGNLVIDVPVPDRVLYNAKYLVGDEFTHMRYTAVTCSADEFPTRGYSLRQQESKRHTELFIVVTMYVPHCLPSQNSY